MHKGPKEIVDEILSDAIRKNLDKIIKNNLKDGNFDINKAAQELKQLMKKLMKELHLKEHFQKELLQLELRKKMENLKHEYNSIAMYEEAHPDEKGKEEPQFTYLRDILPQDQWDQFCSLVGSQVAPRKPHMLHGFKQVKPITSIPQMVPATQIGDICDIFEKQGQDQKFDTVYGLIDTLSQRENAQKLPMPPLKRCAIQGGGAKGAAYAGSYKAMDMLGITDQTDTFCGASAGAITSFMMGLGYNAEQFKEISDNLNFQDFGDYNPSWFGVSYGGTLASQAASVLTKAHVHTGHAFHHWAKGQCAMIFGDPNITFIEMKEWYEKQGLKAPDMVFMGSRVDKKPPKVVFSVDETPHVRVADAVRASMSFPFAWDQVAVHYGKSVERKKSKENLQDGSIHGVYADGGILNNYPIDELDRIQEDPAYQRPRKRNIAGNAADVNPMSYGFSLASDITDLTLAPPTKRTAYLMTEQGIEGHHKKTKEEIDLENEEARRAYEAKAEKGEGKLKGLASALASNLVGSTATNTLDDDKRKVYDKQTVIVHTEGVSVLELDLEASKKKRAENSGRSNVLTWFIAHRDPTLCYEDYYNAQNQKEAPYEYDPEKFAGNAKLSVEDQKHLSPAENKTFKQFVTFLADFHDELAMLKKIQEIPPEELEDLTDEQKQKLANFSDIENNQRLKHLAWQMDRLSKENDFLDQPQYRQLAMEIVQKDFAQKQQKRQTVQENLQKNLALDTIISKINTLLADQDREGKNIECALAIFKGQMSKMFQLMIQDRTLLGRLAQQCDAYQLRDLLANLRLTAHQLDQQDRLWHGGYSELNALERQTFENFAPRFSLFMAKMNEPSLFECLIDINDNLNVLLEDDSLNDRKNTFMYGDPIKALRACIDNNNTNAFMSMVNACLKAGQEERLFVYGPDGLNVFNYLANHPNKDGFISELQKNHKLFAKIKSTRCLFGTSFSVEEQLQGNHAELMQVQEPIINVLKQPRFNKVLPQLINQRLFNGATCLFHAVDTNNKELFDFCMNHNAEINDAGPFHTCASAFTLACKKYRESNDQTLCEMIGKMNGKGSTRSIPDEPTKRTPLHYLAMNPNCSPELFWKVFNNKWSTLSDRFISLAKLTDCDGKTSFDYLVENNRLDVIEHIMAQQGKGKTWHIDDYFDIFHLLPNGKTSLQVLVERAQIDNRYQPLCERILSTLSYNALYKPDATGKTVLHYLVQNKGISPQIFAGRLTTGMTMAGAIPLGGVSQYQARTNFQDKDGNSVLRNIINNNRADIIQYLRENWKNWRLNQIFDLFTPRYDGLSDMQYILRNVDRNTELFKQLNAFLPESIQLGENGMPILHAMVEDNTCVAAKLWQMLQKGVPVASPTGLREDVSHYKNQTSCRDLQDKTLLRKIIETNRVDILEEIAKHSGGRGAFKWYLDHYFDCNTPGPDGLSDIQYAFERGSDELKNVLLKHLSEEAVTRKDTNGQTILHYIAQAQTLPAEFFWTYMNRQQGSLTTAHSFQARTNVEDNAGNTPFRLLVEGGRLDILQDLSKHCGRGKSGYWGIDHYFNFAQVRTDGMTDLAYLLYQAKLDPHNDMQNQMVDIIKAHLSNQDIFKQAEKSAQSKAKSQTMAEFDKRVRKTKP